MNYKLTISKIAFTDMQNIGDYIALTLCSPDAALKLLSKFNDSIMRLKHFPFSGEVLKTQYSLKYEYRRIIVESYVIFYTVESETINIMRVLYGASNYLSVLD